MIEIRVPVGTKLAEIDRLAIEQTVSQTRTQFEAAAALGIYPQTLARRLRKYGRPWKSGADQVTQE